jgi:hypothetical protein
VKPVISPVAIVAAVIGLLLGGLTGSIPWAIVGAVAGWAAGAGVAVAWKRTAVPVTTARIDPFTVNEPWRRAVQDALQARNRFAATMASVRPGPFRERLAEFAVRIDHGVDESWRIAQQGQSITDARRRIDARAADSELATLERGSEVAAALRAQRQAADRLDRTLEDTRQRLRVLNARLDEAVARAAELSVEASRTAEPDTLTVLGAEIDDVVTDMEALRAALEEVDSIGRPPALPGESEA